MGPLESGSLIKPDFSRCGHPTDALDRIGLEQQLSMQGDFAGEFQGRGAEHDEVHVFGHRHLPLGRWIAPPESRYIEVACRSWISTRGPGAEDEGERCAR